MQVLTPDIVNGLFELIGGIMICMDVKELYRSKAVKGVYWPGRAFFLSWGVWNLYFYPAYAHWYSFAGGVLIAMANFVWVALVVRYTYAKKHSS